MAAYLEAALEGGDPRDRRRYPRRHCTGQGYVPTRPADRDESGTHGRVFPDMNMPGLGGRGTLPRIRGLLPDLPVVLVTGMADRGVLDLVRVDAQATLLAKPFTLEELHGHLARLGRPAAGDGDPAWARGRTWAGLFAPGAGLRKKYIINIFLP